MIMIQKWREKELIFIENAVEGVVVIIWVVDLCRGDGESEGNWEKCRGKVRSNNDKAN